MPNTPLFQVDAFADQPFLGNPAAICILDHDRKESWMQKVAAEMNLSETAFVSQLAPDSFALRWFTPKTEVALCGHATLASAHVLWEQNVVPAQSAIHFQTKSGTLTCTRENGLIQMNFPSAPIVQSELSAELTTALFDSMGLEMSVVGRNQYDVLLRVESDETLRNLTPDFHKLAQVATRGVMVTAQSTDPRYDFLSRFFAPSAGIDEDPVTGSAHCCLGPYWGAELSKAKLVGYQASARGGIVQIDLAEDRVVLGGQAVTVFTGNFSH